MARINKAMQRKEPISALQATLYRARSCNRNITTVGVDEKPFRNSSSQIILILWKQLCTQNISANISAEYYKNISAFAKQTHKIEL